MARSHEPEVLAKRVLAIAMVGVWIQVAVIVIYAL
jgi:hypothetical protein